MGKHAAASEADQIAGSPFLTVPGKLMLIAVAVVTVIGAGVLIGPRQALAQLPWAADTACTQTPVDVVVAPELESLVRQILVPVKGAQLPDGGCIGFSVRGQEPQETVASASVLPLDRAPQIWIPDAAVWGQKTTERWVTRSAGSLARTPVVIATSAKAAAELGWTKQSPTWAKALRGSRPVAVPDYRSQSESLDALIALWQTLGKGKAANNEVVGTVFAADRNELPTPAAAIADARSGSAMAPLLPSTEQAVAYLNATSPVPNLVAVYPSEGSPVLDYPILQIPSTDPQLTAASQAVVTRLTSPAAGLLVRRAGFRGPDGAAAIGKGISPDATLELKPPTKVEVDGMIKRIEALSKPSRMLAVMDVSLSMKAKLDDGLTRIQLVGAAARLGANQLPDSGSVGAWVFASKMDGNRDYRVLAPVRQLGSRDSEGESHRSYLMRLATGVDKYLSAGGTSLYDVTIAAMRQMHEDYDPKADNAIILMSDGGNEDATGATLDDVLAEIRTLNSGKQKVAIYTAGLGADADYPAMRKIADASGGYPYRIDTAGEGQRALLDGLNRSRNIGTGKR